AAQTASPAPSPHNTQAAQHELATPTYAAPALVMSASEPTAPAAPRAASAMPAGEDVLAAQSDPAPDAADVRLAGLWSDNATVAARGAGPRAVGIRAHRARCPPGGVGDAGGRGRARGPIRSGARSRRCAARRTRVRERDRRRRSCQRPRRTQRDGGLAVARRAR